MPTNLALDDRLIERARSIGRHKQMEIIKLFGTIDYDPKYDYKAERRRKRA